MKKVLGGILVITALLAGGVSASAEIAIEGENYQQAQGGHTSVISDAAFSGGKYTAIQYTADDRERNELTYSVIADEAGWYSFVIDSSAGDSQWTSNYRVSVNGGTAIDVKEDAQLSNSSNTAVAGTMRKVDMGCVYLKKGKNSVSIIVDEKRKADSQICFYLDKLTFSEPIHSVREVNAWEPFSIFEKGNDVKYDVIWNYPEAKEERLSFSVESYWGETVNKGTMVIAPNSTKYVLNLGKLDAGWYKLFIKNEKGAEVYYDFMSVVPSLSSRLDIEDSPFAMDFASGFETFLREDMDEYVRALKLCGPSMIRERFHWDNLLSGDSGLAGHDKYIEKLADAGIEILGCTHGMGQKGDENLFDTYYAAKNAVEHYEGKIQAWEFGNEPELGFWADSADKYSTYVKAASLGTRDSGVDVLHSSGGMTEPSNILSGGCTDFIGTFMMNDAIKFVDIYGYHSYAIDHHLNIAQKQTASNDKNKRENAFIYGDGKPVWLTEGGLMYLKSTSNDDGREAQARAIVKIMTESAVQGDAKHFWFVFGPRRESLGEFGCFDYDSGKVLPVYSAFANMTYILGSGDYKGRLYPLSQNASGYVFNNSRKDVAVVWSDRADECVVKSPTGVTVTNLMGESRFVGADANGECKVELSQNPVYITFPNGISEEDLLSDKNFKKEYARTELTEAERIIVDPVWTGEVEPGTKISGYSINENGASEMLLNVYNFNDKDIEGVLKIDVGEGFSVSQTEIPVVVPTMQRVQKSISISLTDEAEAGKQAYLSYKVVTDHGESTATVSVLRAVCKVEEVEPDTIIPNSDNADMWDVSNVLQGSGTSAVNTADGVEFNIKFASGDKWFYPQLKIEDPSIFADKTGICYTYYADEELAKSGSTMYIMVWLEDGRQYYLDSRVPFEEGWNQVQRQWDSFTIMSSPLGALDLRQFDPTLIKTFSIGTNASLQDVTYKLKDIGTYIKNDEKHNDEFLVSGIEDGGVYAAGNMPEVTAEIPYKTDPETIRVKTGTIPYDNWKLENGVLKIDLNKLEKGYHTLYIYGRQAETSHYRKKVISFIVE